MKLAFASLALAFLVSCARETPPRAMLPPPSVIAKLDSKPVQAASKATRAAVREIANAGSETRNASAALSDQINHTAGMAAAYPDLSEPFAEIRKRSEKLAAKIAFAEVKERVAIQTIDELDGQIGLLTAQVSSQSAQIDHADTAQTFLRKQVAELDGSDAKRIIAIDKLSWWRSAALWTWGILLALFLLGTVLRRAGRFPL